MPPELKFDLNILLAKLFSLSAQFNGKYPENDDENVLDFSLKLDLMATSLLAPAYFFNGCEKIIKDDIIWHDVSNNIPKNAKYDGSLGIISYKIESQSIFLSIKAGLDRISTILKYFYPEVSSYTTFGRINENGKSRGLMSIANKLKNSDPLMKYMHDQYFEWVQDMVKLRDRVSHYEDLYIINTLDDDLKSHYKHIYLYTTSDSEEKYDEYDFEYFHTIVEKWHDFFFFTIENLKDKEVILRYTT